jgi:LuxR family transcriptional regulator, activator of conjugal transfer of Ti plasmids
MDQVRRFQKVTHQSSRGGHARIFSEFIDRILEGQSPSALCEAMSHASQALGLHSFAYINIAPRSKITPTLISTYPEAWTSRYLQQRFQKHDPVIVRARQSTAPFDWGADTLTAAASSKGREIFEEAAHYGIRYGFSIPVPTERGPCVVVSFATDERRPSFEACIGEYGAVLQFMAMLFHRNVRSLTPRDRQIGDIVLSSREFECLDWASCGKTAWEIGRILGISRSTAAFHLENAKRKLGVRSINQAVARFAARRQASSS